MERQLNLACTAAKAAWKAAPNDDALKTAYLAAKAAFAAHRTAARHSADKSGEPAQPADKAPARKRKRVLTDVPDAAASLEAATGRVQSNKRKAAPTHASENAAEDEGVAAKADSDDEADEVCVHPRVSHVMYIVLN